MKLNAIEQALDLQKLLSDTEAAISTLSASGYDIPAEGIEIQTVLRRAIVAEHALDEALKLNKHYAELLNEHDGGKRMGFSSRQEWIDRLEESNNQARQ